MIGKQFIIVTLLTLASTLVAANPEPLVNSELVTLKKFRCLVCQNQSIADSNAPLAVKMRNKVLFELRQGKSEDKIAIDLQEQFGEFILYDPPLTIRTFILWITPLLFLLVGIFLVLPLRKK